MPLTWRSVRGVCRGVGLAPRLLLLLWPPRHSQPGQREPGLPSRGWGVRPACSTEDAERLVHWSSATTDEEAELALSWEGHSCSALPVPVHLRLRPWVHLITNRNMYSYRLMIA